MDKPNLFLDLDNTLLSAVPIEEIKWTDQNRQLACEFPFHNMEDYYLVFERPGLQEFLDFIFENFNVSIWSAASKDYVLFIIDNLIKIKPGRDLKYIMFSYHCDKCKKAKKGSIKLLDFLWDKYKLEGITKENTFIIDDNDRVVKHNMDNVIHIKEFEFEDGPECKNDRELYNIIPHMEMILDEYRTNNLVSPKLLTKASSAPESPLIKNRHRFGFGDDDAKIGTPARTREDSIASTPQTEDKSSKSMSSETPETPHEEKFSTPLQDMSTKSESPDTDDTEDSKQPSTSPRKKQSFSRTEIHPINTAGRKAMSIAPVDLLSKFEKDE